MTSGVLEAMVVEDDPTWQEILKEMLEDHGFAVNIASCLIEAIPLLKTSPPRLAVVDLSLVSDDPHNDDGLRVLAAIRDLSPNTQAILLTGFATVELAVEVMSTYGVLTVLRKESFSYKTFYTTLQQILVSVPISAKPVPPMTAAVSTELLVSKENSGIALVVEDDAGWQSLLAELLEETGYITRSCSSFGEALSYLQRETFTLAVIDLSLAGFWSGRHDTNSLEDLEGYQLLTQMQDGGIPTIVVSGMAAAESIQQVYAEQGIFAYLEKQTFERDVFLRLALEAREMQQTQNILADLTEREREVLDWLVQGLTNKEIAEKMIITTNTVKRHLKGVYAKLDVNTRAAAVAKAVEGGAGNR